MIFAALGLGGFGLYLLLRGDGPARIMGLILIAAGAGLGFLFWVAIAVERPEAALPPQQPVEIA
jgi:hypothetical protein